MFFNSASIQISRASFSTKVKRSVGVALDIDGVLLRGSHVFPAAKKGLKRLQKHNIPFILLTNGGGDTEQRKAASLSKAFDINIDPSQVVLSHTPMKRLLVESPELRDSHVLVI